MVLTRSTLRRMIWMVMLIRRLLVGALSMVLLLSGPDVRVRRVRRLFRFIRDILA